MEQKQMKVMDKLIAQCRQAYQARMPLIMVDTDEIELMRRLAREGDLVELLMPVTPADDRHDAPYYAYVGMHPNRLELCSNFSEDPELLEELGQKGGAMSYRKPSMLFLLHLTQQSWNGRSKGENSMISQLRRYVNRYVSCQNVSSALKNSCVLLFGDPALLPGDLKPYTEVVGVEYPKTWEIMALICNLAAENGCPYEKPEYARELALQMTGFSLIQAENHVKRLLWLDSEDGRPLLFQECRDELLLDAKAQAIESSGGLLQLYRERQPREDKARPAGEDREAGKKTASDQLGGMKAYKAWAEEAGKRMDKTQRHQFALERGVPALKGVLLCGVPGCGKSEAAKILYRQWGTPMVRMDMDQLMGGLVGDSERNLRQALAQAEAMAPCILWIDELEKGFSAATSGSSDGGTFKRMFGRLLTWMQENTKPCFIFATANDISPLPSEFFRSGRFDALFAVYMPTNDECREIFKEQMRRAQRLREKTAEEQGEGKPRLLFQDDPVMGCFTESALQKIMDLVMEGRDPDAPEGIKFLSGADIQKITTCALTRIPREKLTAPIDLSSWLSALREVIADPAMTTVGSSSANLDKIAACYVRLMRENFAPVSSPDQLLFQKEHYHRQINERKEVTVTYTGSCRMTQPYDRALFYALKDRIELIASQVEANALRRLCE